MRTSEASEYRVRGVCPAKCETELTKGGWGSPAYLSFGLICLFRTPIQTEIKPASLALLARDVVKPVLLLTADVAKPRDFSDEGLWPLLFF